MVPRLMISSTVWAFAVLQPSSHPAATIATAAVIFQNLILRPSQGHLLYAFANRFSSR